MPQSCSVENCVGRPVGRGWCRKHYSRWSRHGDPNYASPSEEERFLSYVVDLPGSDCLGWSGAKQKGYGRFQAASGKSVEAYKWAYERWVGPVPEGKELDHSCHDGRVCSGGETCPHRACTNLDHIVPRTHLDNVRRGSRARRTHCHRGHPFDAANTGIDKRGHRYCRACARDNARRYRSLVDA